MIGAGDSIWVYTSHGWRVGLVMAVARKGYLVRFPLARPVWVEAERCQPLRPKVVHA